MAQEQTGSSQLRPATPADIPAIEWLIAASARGLCAGDYTAAEIEAALGSVWGCDTELIRDGTYFVVEAGGALVAGGGWGRRRTLFGGDGRAGRDSEPLDPTADPARIRAFFVHPAFARRGLGRTLLARCEAEVLTHGFRAVELMATLTGVPLYRTAGYLPTGVLDHPVGKEVIRFIPMRKSLGRGSACPRPSG